MKGLDFMNTNRIIKISEYDLIELIKKFNGSSQFFKTLKSANKIELKHPLMDDYDDIEDYIKAIRDYAIKKQCIDEWEKSIKNYIYKNNERT